MEDDSGEIPDIPEITEPEDDIIFPDISVVLLYDEGYRDRYSYAPQRVTNIAESIRTYYWNEFSLDVFISSPLEYHSWADTCSSDCDNECTHGGDYGGLYNCHNSINTNGTVSLGLYHHTNQYNILYRIATPTNKNAVKMLFIGHNTCREVNGSCYPNTYAVQLLGLCDKTLGISTVVWQENEEYESVIAIHEFGHFFGITDHKSQQPASSKYSDNCLYGYGGSQMVTIDEIIICQGCCNDLSAHINDYTI